jgi:hypothetical protein
MAMNPDINHFHAQLCASAKCRQRSVQRVPASDAILRVSRLLRNKNLRADHRRLPLCPHRRLECENFLVDVRSRALSDCTIYKYKLLFGRIEDFAKRKGVRYLKELDLPTLDQFRSEWKESPLSSLKKLERLKAFLRFCERRKWIDTSPATYMKSPKVPNCPTLPFTREEMLKILARLDKYA